jgi:signal transduction histidine kinase
VLGILEFASTVLATESVTDEAQRQRLVNTVRRTTDRALKIVRSVERLPRSGILADKPTEQTIELPDLIQEVFRQLQDMADARQVELRSKSDVTLAYLDTGALELVLINLVANAIKYSDPEKPTRHVDVVVFGRNEHVEILVRDNGIGIPQDSLTKIFGRFVRAHSELDGALGIEGTGLGLAIAEECVKALGGDIHLESEEGHGTTFTVRIPKKLVPVGRVL